MRKLYDYLKEGYEVSPYYQDVDLKCKTTIRVVDLTSKELKEMISLERGNDTREELLNSYDDDEVVLFKCVENYHYSTDDFIRFLDEYESGDYGNDELEDWHVFFDFKYKGENVYRPLLSDFDNYLEDYLFKIEDHVVVFLINYVTNMVSLNKKLEIASLRKFINDVKNNDYSDSTLSIIIQHLCYALSKVSNKKMLSFYKKNLLMLVKKNDYDSMRTLGYEYYEGSNGFEYDPKKSTYYLEKCYEISKDPELARTLGYIYYYGRTTDGVPVGDKAFQYFAIGHFAGRYFEATYKLADCYVKGYGTPKCYQAAYNLVNDIYDVNLRNFLEEDGEDSKYADVALRMGSYYRDGIYVDKDLNKAKSYYLEAKAAIKKRLEVMEYIGDRNVALGISKSIDELNKDLKTYDREIEMGGYVLKDYDTAFHEVEFQFEIIDDEYVRMIMYRSPDSGIKYLLHYEPSINFVERCEKVELIIRCPSMDEEFIDISKNNGIESVTFANNQLFIVCKDEEVFAFKDVDKVIIIPQTIKNIDKQYTIVSVEFYPGSKLYDYLTTKKGVMVGDTVTINSKGENKKVIVKEIKYLYEDELPLPYEKMAKAK